MTDEDNQAWKWNRDYWKPHHFLNWIYFSKRLVGKTVFKYFLRYFNRLAFNINNTNTLKIFVLFWTITLCLNKYFKCVNEGNKWLSKIKKKRPAKEEENFKKNSSGSWKPSGEEPPVGSQKIIYTWQE